MNQIDLALFCAEGLAPFLRKELSLHHRHGTTISPSCVVLRDCPMSEIAYLNHYIRTCESVGLVLFETQLSSLDQLRDQLLEVEFSRFFANDRVFAVKGFRFGDHPFISVDLARATASGMSRSLLRDKIVAKANLRNPDIDFHAWLFQDQYILTLNTTGIFQSESMQLPFQHQAPIQRTIAAALVLESQYFTHKRFFDPMCGGGTVGIEALALEQQLSLDRFRSQDFAYKNHHYATEIPGKPESQWTKPGKMRDESLILADSSRNKVKGAIENLQYFGLKSEFRLYRGNAIKMSYLADDRDIPSIITNPPYGIRVKNPKDVDILYQEFARAAKDRNVQEIVAITPRKRAWIAALEDVGYEISLIQPVDFGGLPTSIMKAKK
ncbi:THUMP domain-containing protein [Pseudobacteriovorax antillogorgiicola]|uniref:Putative N6-adenine-specific DNA methylase n=1 Tax=Pseudobacteriovorax antillogorgiicola TaxID=1513793 RepID=A0A1Y6B793_9BACT|nr:THUMP domain-containing protein [Pseudobacteriovorax antillogorgiicola]TCS58626.1 putative N6-adenine-specific DNA methylase [Pseudobacteriovorax antillogorgiicola]SME96661.1 putative N6-adenine-specific DNA methylase [Pseudobacteriovorax antillogorgiicola]